MRRLLKNSKKLSCLSLYNTKSNFNELSNKALITVAITGDVPSKNRLAVVPTTPKEQIEDIIKCFESGARMVHVHVRDDEGNPTWDHKKYKEVFDGVQKYCPDMLVQFSTGNYAKDIQERTECFKYRPHMASLTPGSVNFRQTRLSSNDYWNSHQEILSIVEKMNAFNIKPDVAIFDLSMIYAAEQLVRQNLIKLPVRLMYVFGGHMALPAREEVLDFLISESESCFGKENFNWCAVGVGWNHDQIQRWAFEKGGQPRTGLEDTLMIKRRVYAKGNEQLVKHIAELCKEYSREIMTPKEAREFLQIEN